MIGTSGDVMIKSVDQWLEGVCIFHGADGVKMKLSLLLPTLPVARRGYERVVENGVVSSINETKG